MKDQFDILLLHPLLSLGSLETPTPVMAIMTNALDEVEGDEIRIVLHLLHQLRISKAVHLRILLTSRPEWPILPEFSGITSHEHKDLILHENPKPVMQHNIASFLESRLSKFRKERSLPID
jgi:hypothetical protein